MNLTLSQYYASPPYPESLMDLPPANTIEIDGKEYPVYKELKNHITFGQKVVSCTDLELTNHQWIKKILSIIYQPLILNCKFDDEKASEIEKLIDSCQVLQAYTTAMFYLDQLKKIVEFEKEKLHTEPEPEYIQAGMEQLSQFGIFAVVDGLSGGNPLLYEQQYEQPYTTIFTKLWYDVEKAKFEKRLKEVLKLKT